jgi:hypothetical protein
MGLFMKKKGIGIVIAIEPKKKGESMAKKEKEYEKHEKMEHKGKHCDYPEHKEAMKSHKKIKIPKNKDLKKKFENKVGKVMHEYKEGNLHPGKHNAPATHNRKQAIAIALSEAKKATSKKKKK